MSTQQKLAAQYIRMSTDRQDLSPLIQREAIAGFAGTNGFSIIESYEDQGKSGVHLTNRPSLQKLLRDVASRPRFSHVLVFDVSRWGRFQDADAAAYYEYHCRLHGVQVIYVGESFSNDHTPGSVLLKSMRRLMAAEYSRELASKSRAGQHRVISMGYHMGPLPAFGYRRCSVSSDRQRRTTLQHGQLKMALTDRVEWVLGPEPEVALVRRICAAYASGNLELEQIASLVRAEGWRPDKGWPVTTRTIRTLIQNEALIGNFVWGLGDTRRRIVKSMPIRHDGSVPAIVDPETWRRMQERLSNARAAELARLKHPLNGSAGGCASRPALTATPAHVPAEAGERRAPRSPACTPYRTTCGTKRELLDQGKDFGIALARIMSEAGIPAGFDVRFRVLSMWHASVRIRLMWPSDEGRWEVGRMRSVHAASHVLVVRMVGAYRPLDYLLMPERFCAKHFPSNLSRSLPRKLASFQLEEPAELVSGLASLADLQGRVTRLTY